MHDHWEWSKRRPVVRLDFGGGDYAAPDGLQEDLADRLTALETAAGASARNDSAPIRFRRLLEELHRSAGRRVAVLIDEYDKPILDALGTPAIAAANRRLLRSLYSNVKFADAHIHFTLLTGVSKFSKVSVFSGLNNLIDLTLEPKYLGDLRLYRGRPRHGVRGGVAGPGPGGDPRLVQRLQLAR